MSQHQAALASIPNAHVRRWVEECIAPVSAGQRCQICNGSKQEKQRCSMRAARRVSSSSSTSRSCPGCYYHRSNSERRGPHRASHVHLQPDRGHGRPDQQLDGTTKRPTPSCAALFDGCMKGRTMYVVPFVMGPIGSPLAKVGVELTDSLYVAVNMGIMTRMGEVAWKQLGDGDEFTRCLHCVGDCNPERRYICHFPLGQHASGASAPATAATRCWARSAWPCASPATSASSRAGWPSTCCSWASTSPQRREDLRRRRLPHRLRQDQLRHAHPAREVPEGRLEDHHRRRRHRLDVGRPEDGRLCAHQPRSRLLRRGARHQLRRPTPTPWSPSQKDTIYTNVGLLPDGDVWWEGKTDEPPTECIDWTGQQWTPGCGTKAAHPNSRFTAPMSNNPVLDPAAERSRRACRSRAIIFGGRRSQDHPAGLPGVQLDARRLRRRDARLGDDRGRHRAGRRGPPRPDGDAAVLWLQHPRLPHALVPHAQEDERLPAHLPRQLVPQERPGQVHVARLRREHARAGVDHRPLPRPGLRRWRRRSAGCRAPRTSTWKAWASSREDFERAPDASTTRTCKSELLSQEELFLKLAGDMPKEMIFQRELLISRL